VLYPVELRAPYKSIVYSAKRNLSRPMLGSTPTDSEVAADYIGLFAILNRLLLDGNFDSFHLWQKQGEGHQPVFIDLKLLLQVGTGSGRRAHLPADT
jgi:hypothetical protein